ncbi:MAG: NADH-quinone oxidoreductase subunit C [Candidatus Micrarchaeota archaeon]
MLSAADKVKKLKPERLISITSVNKDGRQTLYYHFSWKSKTEIGQVELEVPKGEKVQSLIGIFANAALLEAEVTELFGIRFEGNEFSGKRLFQAADGREAAQKAFETSRCIGKVG